MSVKNSYEPALPKVSRGRSLPPIDPTFVEVSMLLCGARLRSADDGDAGRTFGCNLDAGHEGDHVDLLRARRWAALPASAKRRRACGSQS